MECCRSGTESFHLWWNGLPQLWTTFVTAIAGYLTRPGGLERVCMRPRSLRNSRQAWKLTSKLRLSFCSTGKGIVTSRRELWRGDRYRLFASFRLVSIRYYIRRNFKYHPRTSEISATFDSIRLLITVLQIRIVIHYLISWEFLAIKKIKFHARYLKGYYEKKEILNILLIIGHYYY